MDSVDERPQSITGTLATAAVIHTLYKVPQGWWALVTHYGFLNTSGATDRDVTVYIRKPGDSAGTEVIKVRLTFAFAAGNDITSDNERWILTEGQSIEAQQAVGTDVKYHLSILERKL